MSDATVYIVDDDPSVREGLEMLVGLAGHRVETFATGEALLARAPAGRGCIVLDLRLGGMSGQTVLDNLARRGNAMPVLVLTAYGDIPATVRAVRAGAHDFIIKSGDPAALVARIAELVGLSEAAQPAGEAAAADGDAFGLALSALSPREREVLKLAGRGLGNEEISSHLSLSKRTVEAHRSHIVRKLGVASIADVFRQAAISGRDLDA